MSPSRGHVLLEAVVASGLILVVVSTVTGANARSARQIRESAADQRATLFAQHLLDVQRGAPLDAPEWNVGERTGVVPGHVGWTWKVIVSQVADVAVAAPVETLSYRRAQVSVDCHAGRIELEALRW